MTNEADSPSAQEAVAWFVSLRDGDATARDRARFAAWLAADPRNRQAWNEVAAMWSAMDLLPQSFEQDRGVAFRRRSAWAASALKAAASILLLLGLAGAWAAISPATFTALLADYSAGPQETRDVALPDGSVVTLGASSALSVAFDGEIRRVKLHQGQGYFAVAPDPAHPFVVEAAGGTVTVLGTEFDVRIAGGQVDVAVAKGIVRVGHLGDGGGEPTPVQLSAGQSVHYDPAGIGAPATVQVADIGSWRAGRLVFDSVPLGEVLADLERHRRGRILVTDPALAGLKVTGVFDVHRGDAALETIARTLPVTITYVTDLLVLVRPAS
jgi:transmembrane sensor